MISVRPSFKPAYLNTPVFRQRLLLAGLAALALALICAWYAFMSLDTSNTRAVQKRVVNALTAGLQEVVDIAPRVQVTVPNSTSTYYAPDIENRAAAQSIYRSVLLQLNQDSSAPLCKVTSINVDSDLTSVVDATATVQYLGLFGREKTGVFHASLPIQLDQTPQ